MPTQTMTTGSILLERLEDRRFLSSSPVYAPHSEVRGESLQEYAADWWKKVFSIPVYASDGKTIVNPQFDDPLAPGDTVAANYAHPSQNGKVTFLFGTFFGGTINRTATVPAGTPVFVPIVNTEWSNPDTAAKPDFTTYPGNYTPKELAKLAKQQADTITGLSASLDGKPIKNLKSHREPSLKFTLRENGPYSIHNVFFGDAPTGAFPAAADGYYLMLKPLSPGKHVLNLKGSSPDNTATPPLLGAFSVDLTYTINVVPKGRPDCVTARPHAASFSGFNQTTRISDLTEAEETAQLN